MWEQVHQLHSSLSFIASEIMDLDTSLKFGEFLWISALWFLALFIPSSNWGFSFSLELGFGSLMLLRTKYQYSIEKPQNKYSTP